MIRWERGGRGGRGREGPFKESCGSLVQQTLPKISAHITEDHLSGTAK